MNPITFYPAGVRDNKTLSVGSSDISVIVKTKHSHVKKSARELWQEKTGRAEGWGGNELTYWGHELEPLVLCREIKESHGEEMAFEFKKDAIIHQNFRPEGYKPTTNFLPYTEAIHPQFPWAVAHADCFFTPSVEYTTVTIDGKTFTVPILDQSFQSSSFLLEAKTGRFFSRIARDNMEGFDVSGNSAVEDHHKIPADVLLQVQWQMMCYGIDLTYVLLLVDDNQFFRYEIPAFKKWWPFLLEKASRFINYCVNDETPPPEKKEDVFSILSDLKDSAIYVSGDRALIAEDMKARKKFLMNRMKKDKMSVSDINDAAALLMGENKYLFNAETAGKVFSQSKYQQYGLISPNGLTEEDRLKYEKLGIVKKIDIRKVN